MVSTEVQCLLRDFYVFQLMQNFHEFLPIYTLPNCQDDHLSQQGFFLTLRCSSDVNLDMSIWTMSNVPFSRFRCSTYNIKGHPGMDIRQIFIHHARDTRLVQVRHTLYVISRLPSWPDAHLRGLRQIGLILAAPKMLIRCGYESPPHHHTGAVLGELQEAVVYMGEGYALCRGEGC